MGYCLVNCSSGRYLEGNENVCKGNIIFIAMLLVNSLMSVLTFYVVSSSQTLYQPGPHGRSSRTRTIHLDDEPSVFRHLCLKLKAFLCYRAQYLMRPKDYYDDPIWPKDSDAPSLKVKSVNSHDSKEFTPHDSSWFCTTKGTDYA